MRLPQPRSIEPKALTNEKVIAMVKAGLDDDTVAQTIRAAKLARFDSEHIWTPGPFDRWCQRPGRQSHESASRSQNRG